jgi:hypothetical protein
MQTGFTCDPTFLRSSASRLSAITTPPADIVLTPPDHVRVVGPSEPLDGAGVLDGFHCIAGDLFK